MPKVVPEYREQAKERILKAAQKVFSEKGYHETHMEDIADELGVSKRTLYLYFKNKEDLFRAMCADAPNEIKKMLRKCFEGAGPGPACGALFDFTTSGAVSGLEFEIIAAASRNPTLKKIEKELYENEIEIVSEFLREVKKKGGLAKEFDSPRMARVLVALHRGLMVDLIMDAKKSEVRQAWIEATDLLLRTS